MIETMGEKPFTDQDLANGEELDWSSEHESWNEYKLSDGSVLKVKLVVKGVKRLQKCGADGNPIYLIASDNIVRVLNVPKELKAKPKESTFKPV